MTIEASARMGDGSGPPDKKPPESYHRRTPVKSNKQHVSCQSTPKWRAKTFAIRIPARPSQSFGQRASGKLPSIRGLAAGSGILLLSLTLTSWDFLAATAAFFLVDALLVGAIDHYDTLFVLR